MLSTFERRATTKRGKLAPSLRVAAKIASYFVVVLTRSPAMRCGLRLVWRDFCSQNCHAKVHNRLGDGPTFARASIISLPQ